MSEGEKITTYQVFIEDMIHVFQQRFDELNKNITSLSDHDKGRWMGYHEILDIIKTREDQISEMLLPE